VSRHYSPPLFGLATEFGLDGVDLVVGCQLRGLFVDLDERLDFGSVDGVVGGRTRREEFADVVGFQRRRHGRRLVRDVERLERLDGGGDVGRDVAFLDRRDTE